MASETDPIGRVLSDAAVRNHQIRADTQQAAINLERLIQLVVGSEEIPDAFRPQLLADKPALPWSSGSLSPSDEPVVAPPPPVVPAVVPPPSVVTMDDTAATKDEEVFSVTPMDPQNLRPEDGGVALSYAPGDMLFSKGDPAELFFVITEGQVSLFEPSTGFEMAVLQPGNSLGEQSILMGGVHTLSARAITRVICTTLRADRLRTILDHQAGVVKPVFEAILLQLSMHNELRAQGNRLTL